MPAFNSIILSSEVSNIVLPTLVIDSIDIIHDDYSNDDTYYYDKYPSFKRFRVGLLCSTINEK